MNKVFTDKKEEPVFVKNMSTETGWSIYNMTSDTNEYYKYYSNNVNVTNINTPYFLNKDTLDEELIQSFIASDIGTKIFTKYSKLEENKYMINKYHCNSNGKLVRKISEVIDPQRYSFIDKTQLDINPFNNNVITMMHLTKDNISTSLLLEQYISSYKMVITKEQNISTFTNKHTKCVYKDNQVIFNGVIDINGYKIDDNTYKITDQESRLFKINGSLSESIISTNISYNPNNTINTLSSIQLPNEEIIETDDPNISFTFNYKHNITVNFDRHENYPDIDTFGNTIGKKISNIIVSKKKHNNKDNKDDIVNITNHQFDDGHEKQNTNIDEENHLKVKPATKQTVEHGHYGWKAAITPEGRLCVVKLLIKPDTKVVWDAKHNKYRTEQADVIWIRPVYRNNDDVFYMKILETDECPICMDCEATHIAYPCLHKVCGDCWSSVLEKCHKQNCPHCNQIVHKISKLVKIEDVDGVSDLSLESANSFVHTKDFKYTVGQTVGVNNFDGNLNKACSNGIHYHDNEQDVFQWFKYLCIPSKFRTNESPAFYTNINGFDFTKQEYDEVMGIEDTKTSVTKNKDDVPVSEYSNYDIVKDEKGVIIYKKIVDTKGKTIGVNVHPDCISVPELQDPCAKLHDLVETDSDNNDDIDIEMDDTFYPGDYVDNN